MPRLEWDKYGERIIETGDKKGVLFPTNSSGQYTTGVAWNGLTAVTETPSGADSNPLYADDIKYINIRGAEYFGITIEAYTYPNEFAECDGSKFVLPGVKIGQQKRKTFGFSYVSTVANDTEGLDYGYKIKLVYGLTASPSERSHSTINDSPEGITFSWECDSTPVPLEGHKPVSIITIESTSVDPTKLAALEAILYGTDNTSSRLPMPDEVVALFSN